MEQLQKNIPSTTLLLVFREKRQGSQFLLPVSTESLLAPEHHGGKEGGGHTVTQKDEEPGNQCWKKRRWQPESNKQCREAQTEKENKLREQD